MGSFEVIQSHMSWIRIKDVTLGYKTSSKFVKFVLLFRYCHSTEDTEDTEKRILNVLD